MPRCIFHCTFYKCGSQWVRDVLSDPAIAAFSRTNLVESGRDIPSAGWPVLESPGLLSPMYTAGIGDWLNRPDPRSQDRCLVVVRDPRDIIVSLVMSLAHSHTPNEVTSLLRLPLRHADRGDRIRIGIHLFTHWAGQFRSWLGHTAGAGVLRTDYAELIGDEQAQFRRIFGFLNWRIPDELVTEVVGRHSFVATSGGRRPGEENEFSHRRKGVNGDWRNHFTRETGAVLEEACPGLLRAGGYADSDRWWESLPTEEPVAEVPSDVGIERLLQALEEQEIQLGVSREAAEQRALDVETLNVLCQKAQQEAEQYQRTAEERLALILVLDQQLRAVYSASPWVKILRFCGLPH